QLSISFLAPSRPGDELIANGLLVKRGRNVAHLRGEVATLDGQVVATANGTWAIWQKKPDYMPGRD
ncbi:MAG: PaaI family thioesterase, partial [Candidatus Poseidoniaceae archaeon]|nr:PaaI family thioesterase [Candidatus Poseidoniaceae archaeon]